MTNTLSRVVYLTLEHIIQQNRLMRMQLMYLDQHVHLSGKSILEQKHERTTP